MVNIESQYHLMSLGGSIDTIENWRADMEEWETSSDGLTPEQQFNLLIPVNLDGLTPDEAQEN